MVRWVDMLFWFLELHKWFQKGARRHGSQIGAVLILMVRWVDMLFWFLELHWFQKGARRHGSQIGAVLILMVRWVDVLFWFLELHWFQKGAIEVDYMGCQKYMAVIVSRFKHTAVSCVSHFIHLIVSHVHILKLLKQKTKKSDKGQYCFPCIRCNL